MVDFISFIKYILTSNIINFLIMISILVWIIKKFSINAKLGNAIISIENTIKKSDDEKKHSQKILDEAKTLIDGLEKDVQTLEKNSAEKIEVFKSQIEADTQKTIYNLEQNIDKIIAIEEKKISNILTEKASNASVELAKQHIIKTLKDNPELHNQFIASSLDELEKVKL